MSGIIDAIKYLGIPMSVAIAVLGTFLALQLIGEFVELCGKIVPEFFKIRKYFKRKSNEKKEEQETFKEVKILLSEVNKHYNEDNITKRNEWMSWVNNRAEVYDAALKELILLKDKLNENNEITLDLYINANRNRILDFSRIVADNNALVSTEEFNRIYKINDEYHAILAKYHKENGEVDTAMRIINEAYEYRLKNNCFIENIRGYNK